MKTMNKFIFSVVMVGMLLTPCKAQSNDNLAQPVLIGTTCALGVAAVVYICIDSNQTLLKRADLYAQNVDTCQDLLPPAGWQGTRESYFEQYLQSKFGIEPINMRKGSEYNYHVVTHYINRMKNSLQAARQCVEFRSMFFNEMSYKLSQIMSLELMLARAGDHARYYEDFLCGHQILNFHENLPTQDTTWLNNALPQEQQSVLVKWVRRGFYSNSSYPLLSYAEQISADLKFIRQYSAHNFNMIWYPRLSLKLQSCQDALESAFDILLDSSAYQAEKDAKHKEDILLAEQAKVRAQQAAALAQQQQASALQNQAWAQHRQAWAQEEANRIEREKKK